MLHVSHPGTLHIPALILLSHLVLIHENFGKPTSNKHSSPGEPLSHILENLGPMPLSFQAKNSMFHWSITERKG